MSKLIAVDAGHGLHTAGKRTPDGEREWSFNNKVVIALIDELHRLGLRTIRLDDPSGQRDVPLGERTRKANNAKADVLVSVHHNALRGKWENHTGTEIYSYPNAKTSGELAELLQPILSEAYGLRNRGAKTANFHMLRESNMPAILTEGGYMDSRIDIVKMRDDKVLKQAGITIARTVADWLGVKDSKPVEVASKPTPAPSKPKPSTSKWTKVSGNWSGQTLRRGHYGPPVRQYQEMLASNNFYPNKNAKNNGIDGYFGSDTEDATRRYQSMFADLAVDGMAGRNTYNKLKGSKSVSKPKPKPKPTTAWTGQVLRQGDRGDAVRQLQNMLAKKYFYPEKGAPNNGVDGDYGAKTVNAVKRYQSMHRLTVDGVAGRNTYNSLRG